MAVAKARALRAATNDESPVLRRAERREVLLDAAAELVAAGEIDTVSMEAVAERVGVSRALVYKHFANRHELVRALYERESAHLHRRLAVAVGEATTLEDKLRALVQGALRAQADRGATFAALGAQGGRGRSQRAVQHRRDARTIEHFSQQAVTELGLDVPTARAALGLALGSIQVVLGEWRRRPTKEHADRLTKAYVTMTMGGLRALAGAT
jgi:AcrR family transcriptional regulator